MRCSPEEAVNLLDKWSRSGSNIHCVFLSPGAAWHVNAEAKVHSASSELLTIAFSDHAALRIPLSSCKFSFSEPKELKNQSRELMKFLYESLLVITLPSGEQVYLGERKEGNYDSSLKVN
jgi:hypothetical protein